MTNSEFKNTTMSRSPSYSHYSSAGAGGDGITSSNNNMNSRVNKQVGQLPENLRLNGKTPSGKPRLFVCQVCTRAFARQEHLTRHERSHTKEKPYSCGICNRNFSRRDLLLRHAHKVHGGNSGDSIIRHNKSKVAKKRQSTVATRKSRLSEQQQAPPLAKRRASFSAQSGNYMAPQRNEENHRYDRVKFSTPELLPIDFKEDVEVQVHDARNTYNDAKPPHDQGTNSFEPNLPQISLDTPHNFNLLDSVNWINDYNNEPILTSGTGTAGTKSGASNSPEDDISPASFSASQSQRQASHTNDHLNIKSSWSINETDGALRMKSLFGDRSPSLSSKDTSVMPTSSAAQSNPWLPSTVPAAIDSKRVSSLNNSGIISEKLSHLQFEDDACRLANFTQDVQSIFGRFPNEEAGRQLSGADTKDRAVLENVPEMTNVEAESTGAASDQHYNDPSNDYSLYGLDCLALSNITKAPLPNETDEVDIPASRIFTPELRQMCDHASQYYNRYYNESGANSSNGDPNMMSKDLVLPSCNELNTYVSYYQEFFNSHHPSIHPDFFNLDLQNLRRYIYECDAVDGEADRYLQYSNLTCLPLFVATVGSLFKPGCIFKTMELYEISRRVLHVFLERRKLQQRDLSKGKSTTGSGQHVWLIQSLTLSIIFALFADNLERIGTEMLKRQVSAVCSIIKNNFLTAISVDNNEDSSGKVRNSNKADRSCFESSFEYIMFESKIRCTFNAYKFCQFLNVFYHVDGNLFLNEQDLKFICIPDDEATWTSASLLMPQTPMAKKNVVSFENFYQSFTFNNCGMKPIPESLASIMLYYEYNARTVSSFHIFLTKIDTKKLEMNLLQSYSNSNTGDDNRIDYVSVLKSDNVILRNCLMSIIFFSKVDRTFGSKIWNGQMKDLFNSFLQPKTLNLLTKGSYSLLADFLVALNFSIKNIANILKPLKSHSAIYLDKKTLSMFNLQAYHNDFLILLKFIMDFESTPNFKLLCIYTELKKLANFLLIPYFSRLYPIDFAKFEDISSANDYFQNNDVPDSAHHYSTINVDMLEKLINNVLVYSFNDASFLKMSDQPTSEFSFNSNYPTYHPFSSSLASDPSPPTSSAGTVQLNSETSQPIGELFSDNMQTSTSESSAIQSEAVAPTKSTVDLLALNIGRNNAQGESVINKQRFDERYRLSEKYIVIAKCFFVHVKESYAHCHILDKMTNDFKDLEICLDKERDHCFSATDYSHDFDFEPNTTENANLHGNQNSSSGDILNQYLQSEA